MDYLAACVRRVQSFVSTHSQIAHAQLARRARSVGVLAALIIATLGYVYVGIYEPPTLFPLRTVITVPAGAQLDEVARILRNEQVVSFATALELVIIARRGEERVQAGDYYFDHRLTLLEVADRLMRGEYGLEPLKITVPEGMTTYEMAELLVGKLTKFDAPTFLMLAQGKEGYLFPDTYFFLPNATAHQVLETMEGNFYKQLEPIQALIASSGRPIHEVVTMASLLEKEAYDFEQKRLIAGVLWKRLEIEMPLQVDAVFGYIHATSTFSPKFSHLEVDSPYNTYRNLGLPPGPIGSPGIDSLTAAVTPEPTDALYYLHGRDGSLHISRTFDEHVANRRRYLR